MDVQLREGERLDDLQRNGLCIIQKKSGFRFGMDAVLLSDFTRLRPGDRVADMGTGTGILPLLMSQQREDCTFETFEIQPNMAEMASRSVLLNGLQNRITVHAADLRQAAEILGRESVHAVVCNPPYGKRNSALPNPEEALQLARHEGEIDVGEIVAACGAVLRNGGRLWMVFPAQRLLELCDQLRARHLEPKRIRMVCAKRERPPYVFLIEAVKNARPSLHWLPPLIVCDENGQETPEIARIYHRLRW